MPKKVLLADDEAHITYILSFKLQEAGVEVQTASDGEEALEIASAELPDLIITDFQMPAMSGFELCARLRKNPSTANIPVFMLTARGHRLSQAELDQTNIQMLLAKPFSARELVAKVCEKLGVTNARNPAGQPAGESTGHEDGA